ncbi:hypothetical protein LSTR_LSTR015095 [Laodelphax striatellus]|uniref:Uncharacterized protein n=1 Tax=Laodelphax striatellus TaxID=195883 RepID=A0A482WHG3_LAOST|nr:hypothetical protein LSTR_LSTR015095 [Laodelphax striatellus]
MNKKTIKDLSPAAKQLKTENRAVVEESAVNKKVFKDSLQGMKIEKSLKSEESSGKMKIDSTQGTKSLQAEKTTSTSDELKGNMKSLLPQTINETKIEANLKLCASAKDINYTNKKNTENVSFLPIRMPTTSKEKEGFTSLSVASSEKPNTPLFVSRDTQVTESRNIFEAVKSKPSTDLNSSSTAFKSSSMAVPKTKPLKEDGTLGRSNSKPVVNPEMKPVSKDVSQNKTILSVPKINLDRSAGGVVDKTKKVVPSVDVQVSSTVSGQGSGVLEKNRVEFSKLGGEQLSKELNFPRSLDAPSPTKTPVKLTHVMPAASPVNPQNTMKPISRPSVEVKKTKSVNDTWRQAFKNAKIPKPGQSSPVMTDEKPFVRKPFTSHAMKKQIQFDASNSSTSPRRVEMASGAMDPITPFVANRKPFAVTSTPPATTNVPTNSNVNPVSTVANVATASNMNQVLTATTNVIPVVTVTMSTKDSVVSIPIPAATKEDATRAQRTIDPDELRLKEAELVEDIVRMYGVDYEGVHKNLSIGSVKKSDVKPLPPQILPQTTFNSSTTTERGKQIITFTAKVDNPEPPPLSPVVKNVEKVQTPTKAVHESSSVGNEQVSSSMSPAKPASPMLDDKPKGPGKHHNLPLPVEQTLKKLQTKSLVTKKPPPLQKPFQDLRKQQQQQINIDKNVSLTSSRTIDSNVSPFLSDFPSSSGLLNKKKVNMSTEEIKKWLNDSTSTGIEHTKDCGIFEKNQCECGPSFGDDKTSPLTSEPSSPVITEAPNKTLKVSDSKVVAVDTMEAGPSKSSREYKQQEKVVSEAAVVETKMTSAVIKQQNSSPQTAALAKSLDSPKKSSECKSAFVGGALISNRGKFGTVDRTPTKDDGDKLKLSIDAGEGRKTKGDAQSSPSAQFSPPMAVSQLHHETSSNDDSPEKSSTSSVQHERRSIFQQKRSVFRSRPSLSRSPSAFSPENESSVYAFEPDQLPPTSTPFRASRAKGQKEGRTSNATTDDEDAGLSSNSIAVQVNIDSEEVSTQFFLLVTFL